MSRVRLPTGVRKGFLTLVPFIGTADFLGRAPVYVFCLRDRGEIDLDQLSAPRLVR